MSASRIVRVAELCFSLAQYDWAFARERREEIRAHWERRRAERPSLFDGRMLLMFRHEFETRGDGSTRLTGQCFETAYSNFLYWRDFDCLDESVCNGFSMAALQSADGAFLLGEMGAHTASAGNIYFAAGTPDLQDVFDGRVDLGASVTRELEEETGIRADETEYDDSWVVVYQPPRIACMKIMQSSARAEALRARIETFLKGEKNPELARIHIARAPGDIDETRTPGFVRDFLAYALDCSRDR